MSVLKERKMSARFSRLALKKGFPNALDVWQMRITCFFNLKVVECKQTHNFEPES